MKKKISIIIAILTSITILLGVYSNYKETGKVNTDEITKAITTVTDVLVSDSVNSEAIDTINATLNGGKVESKEIAQVGNEKETTDEGATETDGIVEQENIEYNGDNSGNGLSLLGTYQGLTYYSQADSRWASIPYTSTGNYNQTMKSSACGPTSAAIVVSSSKGAILPTTMANLFVDNNFRTANSGTAWAAYSFVADYFGFDDYHTTTDYNTMINYLKQGYFVIASCGSGLFTSGGHYIVLVSDDNGIIRVFDPYLYNGKFNTASRRKANVKVEGTSVYLSEDSFEKYSNYKRFWIYSNDSGKGNTITNNTEMSIKKYVKVSTRLNVRSGPGVNYPVVGKLTNGSEVIVKEINGEWSKTEKGWVNSSYLTDYISNFTKTYTPKYTVGTYKVTASTLRVRTGPGTNYRTKTYKQLSYNARQQNKRLGNYYTNGYKRGVVCKVTKIKGNWGLTKSGWICLDYCE